MMKAVFILGVNDDKVKRKVLKTITGLPGVDSVSMDVEDKKLTVIGDIDPLSIVKKLRKLCHTEIVAVGPANQPERKDDDKKKKDDDKKKKDDDETKKDDEKKRKEELHKACRAYKKILMLVLFAKLWGFLRRIKKSNKSRKLIMG